MQIKRWKYHNVSLDGAVKTGGQVDTGFIIKSSIMNCCAVPDCNCSKDYWVSINLGLQLDSSLIGATYYFTSEKAQIDFLTMN